METFWKIFHRIIFGVRIALVVILLALCAIPLMKAPSNVLRNATLQQARSERIAKDALILEYRPLAEHAQAISELQDTLPVWRSEQQALLGVNDPQVQILLQQSNTDFTPMSVAVAHILAAGSKPVDPIQVTIIVSHEHDYAATLNLLATQIQADTASVTVQFFGLELGLLIASVALTIVQARRVRSSKGVSHVP